MVFSLHDEDDAYTKIDHDNDNKVKVKRGILWRSLDIFFVEGRGTIHILRWMGVLIVLWNERLTFLLSSLRCIPSEYASKESLHRLMITILADPQLIDRDSYENLNNLPFGLNKLAYTIVRWAANTYVRKAFQAVIRTQGRAQSDAVIWLGDLLDGGRRAINTNEDVLQYEDHVSRFKSLFYERIPSIYVPGNHDVRIPLTHNVIFEGESLESRQRWLQSWGTWYDDERKRYTWSVGQSINKRASKLNAIVASRNIKDDQRQTFHFPHSETDRYQKRAPLPSFSKSVSSQKVILRPKGGPERIIVESNGWRRTVNAKFPLYLDSNGENPTHEIVLVDALDLAGMSPATSTFENRQQVEEEDAWLRQPYDRRREDPQWYKEGKARFKETLNFIEGMQDSSSTSNSVMQEPIRILISHVPLHRPTNTPCSVIQPKEREERRENMTETLSPVRIDDMGWHRESFHRDNIEQGVDQYATYQNMLARPVSQWLLHNLDAQLILSGDDHDHCHVRHQYHGRHDRQNLFAEELTLKAFSMTGGVRTPGYGRVVLSWDNVSQKASVIAMPCALPDQIQIWTKAYPLCLLTFFIYLVADRKWRFGNGLDRWMRDRMIGFSSSHIAIPFPPFNSTTSGFEVRARREIRRTAILNRPIYIERNILREIRGMLVLPLIVWLWLQLF